MQQKFSQPNRFFTWTLQAGIGILNAGAYAIAMWGIPRFCSNRMIRKAIFYTANSLVGTREHGNLGAFRIASNFLLTGSIVIDIVSYCRFKKSLQKNQKRIGIALAASRRLNKTEQQRSLNETQEHNDENFDSSKGITNADSHNIEKEDERNENEHVYTDVVGKWQNHQLALNERWWNILESALICVPISILTILDISKFCFATGWANPDRLYMIINSITESIVPFVGFFFILVKSREIFNECRNIYCGIGANGQKFHQETLTYENQRFFKVKKVCNALSYTISSYPLKCGMAIASAVCLGMIIIWHVDLLTAPTYSYDDDLSGRIAMISIYGLLAGNAIFSAFGYIKQRYGFRLNLSQKDDKKSYENTPLLVLTQTPVAAPLASNYGALENSAYQVKANSHLDDVKPQSRCKCVLL
jgi:hypothetical protein